jgi:dihydrofolate reductase
MLKQMPLDLELRGERLGALWRQMPERCRPQRLHAVRAPPKFRLRAMGLLTFSLNVTLDGCVDHREGVVVDETHAFFTRLMDEGGAMLWGRTTYEMMESYWPAVARGEVEAPPALQEWAVKLEAKPKYIVSSTRKDYAWTNSHHIAGDLHTGGQRLKDTTPGGVAALLGFVVFKPA